MLSWRQRICFAYTAPLKRYWKTVCSTFTAVSYTHLEVYKRQVYERIMAQNEMYRKLAAAEAEVADGAELLDGMEVRKELRGKYGK